MESSPPTAETTAPSSGIFSKFSYATFVIAVVAVMIFVAVFIIMAFVIMRDRTEPSAKPTHAEPEPEEDVGKKLDDLDEQLREIGDDIDHEAEAEIEKRRRAIGDLDIVEIAGIVADEESSADDRNEP